MKNQNDIIYERCIALVPRTDSKFNLATIAYFSIQDLETKHMITHSQGTDFWKTDSEYHDRLTYETVERLVRYQMEREGVCCSISDYCKQKLAHIG